MEETLLNLLSKMLESGKSKEKKEEEEKKCIRAQFGVSCSDGAATPPQKHHVESNQEYKILQSFWEAPFHFNIAVWSSSTRASFI